MIKTSAAAKSEVEMKELNQKISSLEGLLKQTKDSRTQILMRLEEEELFHNATKKTLNEQKV